MLEYRIESLLKLKSVLNEGNPEFNEIAQRAELENPWFTQQFIRLSVQNITESYLSQEKLKNFAYQYTIPSNPKKIGIVMAGNIPLVGFHDLLCGILSGHKLRIKCSSKDNVLMPYVIKNLRDMHSDLANSIEIADNLTACDAYIATGSNQSNVYFDQYFGKYPNILRKSRSSIAIMTGKETAEDLVNLGKDVHFYFGLGCRNVSKIYVPHGYNFEPLVNAFKEYEYLEDFTKYKNNLDYNLSLLLLNQQMFMSTKALLLVENTNFHAPISVLHYEHYESKSDIVNIMHTLPEVQAIIGNKLTPFGSAQNPSIDDFADGIDTMLFLTAL